MVEWKGAEAMESCYGNLELRAMNIELRYREKALTDGKGEAVNTINKTRRTRELYKSFLMRLVTTAPTMVVRECASVKI